MTKSRLLVLGILMILFIHSGFCQDYPFSDDIRKFKENDKINPPPQDAILFAGSSSFTMWTDMQEYFPGYTIINRGFGGSTLLDQIDFAEDIILPNKPRQIVIYCGENDLANSETMSGEMVTKLFILLFNMIREELPDVQITYVSMKPSPSRWNLSEKMIEGNNAIKEFLSKEKNTGFVDIWDDMLDENNKPDSSLFLEDMLHMNSEGYKIWQKKIEPALIR